MSNSKPWQSEAVEQVEREHEQLRELIGAIHKSLAEPSAPTALVKEQLSVLCDKLEDHFRTEEDEGFFSEITEEAPRLSDQADKLCQEHRAMLEEAKTIATKAILCDQPQILGQEIQPAFHEFSKHLMHHESAENEMLQHAYLVDIGPAD